MAGSSQEAKGFISHSCFPFLWFMTLDSGRTRLRSSVLSPLPPSPCGKQAVFWRCREGLGGVPLGEEAQMLDLLSGDGWSTRLSASISGLGHTSHKALGMQTEVKATIHCCCFYHLPFDFWFSSGKMFTFERLPTLLKAIIIRFYLHSLALQYLRDMSSPCLPPTHDLI